MRCGFLIALALALVPAGCKVGPKYVEPNARFAQEWQQAVDERVHVQPDQEEIDNSAWWKVFNDPVLDRLIETAYAQNNSVQLAGLRVLEARAQRGIAAGLFFPQLQGASGNAGGVHLSDNAANTTFLDTKFGNYSLGLQAAWELDFWGKFRRAIDLSDAALLASVATYDDVLVSVIGSVAATYVEFRTFEERLALARANVAIQQRSLEITQVRFRNGLETELDVAQARTNLASTQSLMPLFEQGRLQAANRLCALLGLPPQDVQELLGPVGKIPTAPREIALGIPADLLRRRPDVRAAERLAAAQSERIGIATADFYPSVAISGFTGFDTSTGYDPLLGLGRSPGLGNIFDARSFSGFINLGFNWPILNYGRIANNVRVQDARFEQAATAYRDSVIRAAAEVENGLVAFLQSQERTAFLAESVSAAERSVELAQTQYRDGACDFTRVLDTQTALTVQQDAHAFARAEIAFSLIGTYRALGGGWQIRGSNEFIPAEMAERMRARTDWDGMMSVEETSAGEELFGLSKVQGDGP